MTKNPDAVRTQVWNVYETSVPFEYLVWVTLSLPSFIGTVFNRLVGEVKQKLRWRFVCK